MTDVLNAGNLVFETSTTATTGGTISLAGAATGYRRFRDEFPDGSTGVALELSSGASYEFSYGTLVYGSPDTISSRTIIVSGVAGAPSAVGVPVAWGAGTRNAICAVPGAQFLYRLNAAQIKVLLGLGTGAFVDLGTDSAGLQPSSRLGLMDPVWMTANSWSGGTNGSAVVRSAGHTLVDATNTMSVTRLSFIGIKTSAGVHFGKCVVTGLSGLTAGALYYLGSSAPSNLTTTAPTPGGSASLVVLGVADSATVMLWDPRILEEP